MKSAKEDSISIDNKLLANDMIDIHLNIQKRLVSKEHKQRKCKKKVDKLFDDLYEPSEETNVETNEEVEIKLRLELEIIEEPYRISTSP
jgi:hypothetical protein